MKDASTLNPSWPIWATGLSAGLLGSILAATVVMLYHVEFVRESQKTTSSLRSKISLLEVALNQAQPYTLSLEEAPAPKLEPVALQPSPVAQVQVAAIKPGPQPVVAAAPANQPAIAPRPSAPAAQPQAQQVKPTAPAPSAPQQPPAAAKTAQAVPAAQPAPVVTPARTTNATVTPDELAAALKKKIEVMSMTRVGVAKLHADTVEFISGRRVRTGELFPSGEKLLKVDPADGRIVTNERQLIVFEQ